jgi:hypothetical protein
MLHLRVRQIAEPRRNDHQICGLQGFKTWNIVVDIGIDLSRGRVNGEHDRALEPMRFGENLRELRQRFFRSVFFVATDKYDMLTVAWTFATLKSDPRIIGISSRGRNASDDQGDCE